MLKKTCAFFGHRKIEKSDNLHERLKVLIEALIIDYGIEVFLFGSRSEFDAVCLTVVTELKEIYPRITRVAYTCKNEGCILESEKDKWKKLFQKLYNSDLPLLTVDEERNYPSKHTAGRASYVERNYAMINDCDICVFYYDEAYLPPKRLRSKCDATYYQPKSGTRIAYEYAIKHHKTVFNVKKVTD